MLKMTAVLFLTLFSTLALADESKEMTEDEFIAYMEAKYLPPRAK